MEEQLISFNTAKLAKEKGFNEKCTNTYMYGGSSYKTTPYYFEEKASNSEIESQSYSAPTQSLLQKWLRETHNIHIMDNYMPNIKKWDFVVYDLNLNGMAWVKHYSEYRRSHGNRRFNSYEEALENGLVEALELIK